MYNLFQGSLAYKFLSNQQRNLPNSLKIYLRGDPNTFLFLECDPLKFLSLSLTTDTKIAAETNMIRERRVFKLQQPVYRPRPELSTNRMIGRPYPQTGRPLRLLPISKLNHSSHSKIQFKDTRHSWECT